MLSLFELQLKIFSENTEELQGDTTHPCKATHMLHGSNTNGLRTGYLSYTTAHIRYTEPYERNVYEFHTVEHLGHTKDRWLKRYHNLNITLMWQKYRGGAERRTSFVQFSP